MSSRASGSVSSPAPPAAPAAPATPRWPPSSRCVRMCLRSAAGSLKLRLQKGQQHGRSPLLLAVESARLRGAAAFSRGSLVAELRGEGALRCPLASDLDVAAVAVSVGLLPVAGRTGAGGGALLLFDLKPGPAA
ncbi:hypothetical protein EYF80_056498 [Liparis tanakae]|uniref:Uncharacterized protein n=1 Tax=Liparis tanakae TaxID=230148 RepID=A0A4Z2EX11_9TELE|nr:hypothetical protein EYF80_056498 [Liparis tanakae]